MSDEQSFDATEVTPDEAENLEDPAAEEGVKPDNTTEHSGENANAGGKSLSVGARVFAVVSFGMVMIALVTGWGIFQMERIGTKITDISGYHIPVSGLVSGLKAQQLEQAIALEQGLRHGFLMETRDAAKQDFAMARENFSTISESMQEDFRLLIARTDAAIKAADSEELVSEIKETAQELKIMRLRQADFEGQANDIFNMIEENDVIQAEVMTTMLADMQANLIGKYQRLKGTISVSVNAAGDVANKRKSEATLLMIAAAGISIVIGLLVSWLLVTRSIARPLHSVTEAIQELTSGNTDVEIAVYAEDEIGRVARALEVFRGNMIDNERLKEEQRTAERAAEEDARRREDDERIAASKGREDARQAKAKAEQERRDGMLELAGTFESSVGHVIETVATAAEQFSEMAQSMSAAAAESSRQTGAVATATREATENVETVAGATTELTSSISEISRQVTESTRIAQNAVEQAKSADTKVLGLSDAASKIGDVVDLINDIASQTNLLALNATIEAARAGDAGKGFAVVAAEVKTLADQTGKATEEIATQIGSIQSATDEAVEAIRNISVTISSVNEISSAISAAVEQQGAATQDIATNVTLVADGTKEVTATISTVSDTVGATGTAANELLDSAKALTGEADTLRAEVDKFLTTVRAA